MRLFPISIIALLFALPSIANTDRYVSPSQFSLSGIGWAGDEYSFSFHLKPSTKGLAVKELKLSTTYDSFSSNSEALSDVYDPIVTSTEIENSAGVYGIFYRFIFEYGQNLECNRRMKLLVKQPIEIGNKELELKKINPCNESS